MVYSIKKYFKNSNEFLNELKKKPEDYWIKRGGISAMTLFQEMQKKVPAYNKFLQSNNIKIDKIKNIDDLKIIPSISKIDYLTKNSLPSLCWNGKFSDKNWIFSATSGSTGEPFYFPRTEEQDLQYALTAELYFLTNFNLDKKSTLYINAFAMGVWIGGLFTYQSIKHIAEKGKYKISIINPGINKLEILRALKKLGEHFDQVIIGGYPPFIKDFVDYATSYKLNWNKYNIKFIFSAEGFNEDFRYYIFKKAHLKNYFIDTLNHYGTVDIGTMSYETPLCILIRKLALKNNKFYKILFGENNKLPTLTQYIPEQFYFESFENHLFCSASSGLPLFRYNLKDLGGIYMFSEVFKKAKKAGINLKEEIKKVGIKNTIWKIPFVYVYEREDFSVSFYGANIYPETIREVLLKNPFNKIVTGKCVLEIKMTKKQNPNLYIHIEKNLNIKITQEQVAKIHKAIHNNLLNKNSEYKNNFNFLRKGIFFKVNLLEYNDQYYFSSNGKHKWIKK